MVEHIKETLPKGSHIIKDGSLRVVKKPDGYIGYAAMNWEGMHLLVSMILDGQINRKYYKISTLLDGMPFMAEERKRAYD